MTAARLALATAILFLLLLQPNHPDAMTPAALLQFPLELPPLLLTLMLLGNGRAGRMLRRGLAAAFTVIAVIKIADFAMFTSFGRSFNPMGDMPLAVAGFRLLSGTVGLVPAVLAVAALALALIALGMTLSWAMAIWARVSLPAAARRIATPMALALMALAVGEVATQMNRWHLPVAMPGTAFTARVGAEKIRLILRTVDDLRIFRAAAAADPFRGWSDLLDELPGDVLVIFLESYGRASLDVPLYADTHRPILATAEMRLTAAGLAMRSGFLASPTRGGQSWLAHGTFATGLRITDQVRYQAALASGRETLFHIAARSGFLTAAVMPAIVLPWPESAQMGFQVVLPAADLGYRGKPFNWVTMPDQFTLSALDRLLRLPPRDRPLFAQVALVSSHAPWVPVPQLIPWDQVGDGSIFNAMVADSGDPPEVIWRDPDRVRDQYRLSIAYTLETVFDYVARLGPDAPLIFVLGDHQAAGFVAQSESADVPLHVIGPPELVARTEGWGLTPGLIPSDGHLALSMERMRDLILRSFSSDPPP